MSVNPINEAERDIKKLKIEETLEYNYFQSTNSYLANYIKYFQSIDSKDIQESFWQQIRNSLAEFSFQISLIEKKQKNVSLKKYEDFVNNLSNEITELQNRNEVSPKDKLKYISNKYLENKETTESNENPTEYQFFRCFTDISCTVTDYSGSFFQDLDKFYQFLTQFKYKLGKDVDECFFREVKKCQNTLKSELSDEFIENVNSIFSQDNDWQSQVKEFYHLCQSSRKMFFYNFYLRLMIRTLLDQKTFLPSYEKISGNYFNDGNEKVIVNIKSMTIFADINCTYGLVVDKNMHFFLQKKYSNRIEQDYIDNEIDMLQQDISKFIVRIDPSTQHGVRSILVPYFPLCTLFTVLQSIPPSQGKDKKSGINLSVVDKVVLIKEIAMALESLHSKGLFHGHLSSQFISLSSTKDAYINSFCYSYTAEKEITRPRGFYYYRSKEIIELLLDDIPNIDSKNESDIPEEMFKNADLHSFALIAYEIITETLFEEIINDYPRDKKLECMKNCATFLFEKERENINVFDANCTDSFGNSLYEFKRIILNCMNRDSKDENNEYSFVDVLNDIENTIVYSLNKAEIEARIESAVEPKDYDCSIANLFEAFIIGHDYSLEIIKVFFEETEKSFDKHYFVAGFLGSENYKTDETKMFVNDKYSLLIKLIFDKFNIESEFYFDALGDVLNKYIRYKIDPGSIDTTDPLLNLSFYYNSSINSTDLITPISTLSDFSGNDGINPLISIYAIVRELSEIHSRNLFHGDLSMKNIGVYYNHETKTFVPSIILFYPVYVYKQKSNANIYEDETNDLLENQQKDIEDFVEILKQFKQKYIKFNYIIISIDQLINAIDRMALSSINVVCQILYNSIDTKNRLLIDHSCNYKLLSFSYDSLIYVYKHFNISKIYDISVKTILSNIDKFLDLIQESLESKKNYSISDCMSNALKSEKMHSEESENIIKNIKNKVQSISEILLKNEKVIDEEEDQRKSLDDHDELLDDAGLDLRCFTDTKKEQIDDKLNNMRNKYVFRGFEFGDLSKESFRFLLRRYICSLNQEYKYRITVVLNGQKSDEKITLGDINAVTKKTPKGLIEKDPEIVKGNAIFYIENTEKPGIDEN